VSLGRIAGMQLVGGASQGLDARLGSMMTAQVQSSQLDTRKSARMTRGLVLQLLDPHCNCSIQQLPPIWQSPM